MSSELKKGAILSETSFYVVEKKQGDGYVCNLNGGKVFLPDDYIDKHIDSADRYAEVVKVNLTELQKIFLSNVRVAMSVCYDKADKKRTKKDYKETVNLYTLRLKTAFIKNNESEIDRLIKNPVLPYTKGEERIMKGYHKGRKLPNGRIEFVDMEADRFPNKQVDSRTIKYLIVGNKKYERK